MSSSHHRPAPPKPMDLELTIISAKHLKNVNWRKGDLTPYVIFFLDPNRKLATKSDDSNGTKPVWNERFILPVQPGPGPALLSLEVFHSNPADTNAPLVGSLTVRLDDVVNGDGDVIRSFDLKRRSGRAQGRIRLKMRMRQRVDVCNYQTAPQHAFYYTSAPPPNHAHYPGPPSPVSAPSQHSYSYRSGSDPYGGYYAHPPPQNPRPGGYGAPSPLPAQWPGAYAGAGPNAPVDYAKLPPHPHTPRTVDGYGGGGAGPSAPVDYAQYEQKQKTGKLGLGLGVGGVIGGMSGLSIHEGSRFQEEKVVESELNAREMEDYTDYRRRVDY